MIPFQSGSRRVLVVKLEFRLVPVVTFKPFNRQITLLFVVSLTRRRSTPRGKYRFRRRVKTAAKLRFRLNTPRIKPRSRRGPPIVTVLLIVILSYLIPLKVVQTAGRRQLIPV